MGVIIEESGMQFGEYQEDEVFQIETSEQYTKKLRQNKIKSCEFILQREDKLYFFEAKSSCPRQIVEDIPDDDKEAKKKRYNEFVEEIVLKMRHSLSLYGNILLKRYTQNDVPNSMTDPNLMNKSIYLILVINTNGAWAPEPELEDDLNLQLNDVMKIWQTKRLLVINDQTAREKHFIL